MRKFFGVIFLLFLTAARVYASEGYTGTLPDIEAEFNNLRSIKTFPAQNAVKLDSINEKNLKSAPLNNESYIDIVIKKSTPPEYAHDLHDLLAVLEKMRKCLDTNQDIQMFNAVSSSLIDNIEYILVKYKNKPEHDLESYKCLPNISALVRETASFRTQKHLTAEYIPAASPKNIYTDENLDKKLENLLINVNETIFILNSGL